MTVRLTHTSHGAPPQLLGIEIDDNGRAAGWQTFGYRVGRFGRELSARERTALARALSSAGDADAGRAPEAAHRAVRPGGATEQLIADGLRDVVLDANGTPPAGFADLIGMLLTLREDLAESPLAAIELAVSGSPLGARLRHVGFETVAVRMGTLTLRATLFGRDSAIVDSATHTVDASGVHGPVGSEWELPLAENLGLAAPRQGGFLTVTVGTPEVDALGDGVLRPAEFSWMTE